MGVGVGASSSLPQIQEAFFIFGLVQLKSRSCRRGTCIDIIHILHPFVLFCVGGAEGVCAGEGCAVCVERKVCRGGGGKDVEETWGRSLRSMSLLWPLIDLILRPHKSTKLVHDNDGARYDVRF